MMATQTERIRKEIQTLCARQVSCGNLTLATLGPNTMIIGTIDFPQEVIDAQRDGRLVVFAGAGVSMPPPSSLPDFETLADRIGAGCRPRKEKEPRDEYLGLLHEKGEGVRVHEQAASILLTPDSKPTELHKALLRLFHPKTPVRIVTTNFDNHFTTAAVELEIRNLEINSGPALPLGNDFESLIYLHGAASRSPLRIVLTDADFGRAYLTEAWASRFLYQMFSTYTVLFVGYSHDDVVMKYIAKGLPGNRGPRRFMLTDKKDRQWTPFGIQPVYYDLCDGDNSHLAVIESVQEWTIEIHRGLHERAERIRSILEGAPPLGGSDADYLRAALRDPDTAKQFRKYAQRVEYVDWAEKNRILKTLFQNDRQLTAPELEVAEWFTRHCVPSYHEESLAAFQRGGPVLNSGVCRQIAHALTYRRNEQGYGSIFSVWAAILLSQPGSCLVIGDWEQLLNSCQWPDDREIALLLLERCFQPALLLKEEWNLLVELTSPKRKLVDYEIDLSTEHTYWLSRCWETFFKPQLGELGTRLESVVTSSLERTNSLLRVSGKCQGRYDPLGFRRQRIKESQSLGSPHALDVLIDAVRDLMNHFAESDPIVARRLIAKWSCSESPILKRVAIHGVAVDRTMASDEKIGWLLQRDLLFHPGAKPEAFDVLKDAYPSATFETRRKLFDLIDQKYRIVAADQNSDDFSPYDVFNLITWLSRADPTCEIAKGALASIREKHPAFEAREGPDVSFTSVPWSNMGDSINLDEVIANPPSEWIRAIVTRPRSEGRDFDLDERVHAIMRAVARKPSWGFELQKYLVDQDIQDPAIWIQLFNGWREAKLEPPQWAQLLSEFSELPDWQPCADGIAEVLESGSRRQDHALSYKLMPEAFRLSQKAFTILQQKCRFLEDRSKDWLGIAINRSGGKLAIFWLQYLSCLKEESSSEWQGLPEPIKAIFREVIKDDSDDSRLARVVLVSQLHYLSFLDREFALEVLIPLLDWSKDATCAVQCWQGFLGWGKWNTSFLEPILPFYHQTLNHLEEFDESTSESFVQHVAAIAVYGVEQPWLDGWLPRYLEKFTLPERRTFAETVRRILEGMSPEASAELWERWLKTYWRDRTVNKPVALNSQEVDHMVPWPLYLHSKFAEAVELLKRSPKFTLMTVDVKEEITIDYKRDFTDAAGEYVNLLIGALRRGDDHHINSILELLDELIEHGLSQQIVRKILDSLAKLN